MIEQFLSEVGERDVLQHKYLLASLKMLTEEETATLEQIFAFFEKNYGEIAKLAEAYLLIVDDFREETKYFLEHGKYRNSSYKEVAELVYFNEAYMEQYMIGLVLSDYIWSNHVQITRWFKHELSHVHGERYFEIGPGFGHYFLMAINHTDFKEYKAVDVSKKSVEGAKKFVTTFCGDKQKQWSVECKDFLAYEDDTLYDCIVMGEVLEHVENPEKFLEKVYRLLDEGGTCFISTVINAPAIDHIHLFSSVEEVTGMLENAGFDVEEHLCTTENGVLLEKALKKKRAVTIILKLKK